MQRHQRQLARDRDTTTAPDRRHRWRRARSGNATASATSVNPIAAVTAQITIVRRSAATRSIASASRHDGCPPRRSRPGGRILTRASRTSTPTPANSDATITTIDEPARRRPGEVEAGQRHRTRRRRRTSVVRSTRRTPVAPIDAERDRPRASNAVETTAAVAPIAARIGTDDADEHDALEAPDEECRVDVLDGAEHGSRRRDRCERRARDRAGPDSSARPRGRCRRGEQHGDELRQRDQAAERRAAREVGEPAPTLVTDRETDRGGDRQQDASRRRAVDGRPGGSAPSRPRAPHRPPWPRTSWSTAWIEHQQQRRPRDDEDLLVLDRLGERSPRTPRARARRRWRRLGRPRVVGASAHHADPQHDDVQRDEDAHAAVRAEHQRDQLREVQRAGRRVAEVWDTAEDQVVERSAAGSGAGRAR